MSRRRPRHTSRVSRRAPLPSFLQPLHTDEFLPPAPDAHDQAVVEHTGARAERAAQATATSLPAYQTSRRGTAAGLLALNEEWGARFYDVPREAPLDEDAAAAAFAGDEVVIDVQTHYMVEREGTRRVNGSLLNLYKEVAPDWWKGLDGVTAYSFAEYLRCVYLDTETTVAVLTSGPGTDDARMLFNPELLGTRELLDRLAPAGRMLQHSVIHPDLRDEFEAMEETQAREDPAGWKVYTLGQQLPDGSWHSDWMLDDDEVGGPFLERVRALGGRRICTHKGVSALAPAGSPRDIGPAARANPDLDFIVYHSGYEMPTEGIPREGPFRDDTCDIGVNRLVHSLAQSGIGAGDNVYAELGTTWFCLIKRPVEAAHVLGKLLLAVGEDNIVWGTDSIWFGPAQPLIDAFRAFQIPPAMREEFGYPELTPAFKEKVLSLNAARVYDIDLERAKQLKASDDLAWTREALAEARKLGFESDWA